MTTKLICLVFITVIAIGCGPTLAEEPSGTQKQPTSVAEAPKPPTVPPTPLPPTSLTPTAVPPTPLPSNVTPAPRAASISPTATSVPTKLTQPSSGLTFSLEINEIAADLPKYVRGDWKHWIDEDKDCQNTRHEVLIEESLKVVTFKSDKRCQVAMGEWLAPFTGDTVTDATKLDVDHMVPLKNAHDSGGWAWDKGKKAAYANEMGHADHLIAVTASANRQKGASGPERWKPANQDYWCDYAIDWAQIKADWGLSATKAEWTALQEMIATCESPPSITVIPSKAEPPPTAKPVILTTTPAPPAAPVVVDVLITSLDCKGKPEIMVVENAGTSAQDMIGWKVEDRGSKNTFSFPAGFSLEAGASVELVSGASGDDTGETIYWNKGPVWNNDGDTGSLIDSSGQLASEMKCP
jgi:hypothetical protein